jgi:hypothetical protein
MHDPRSYSYLTRRFFFLPVSGSSTISEVILMELLGQAIWHRPQAMHLLFPSPSAGMVSSPQNLSFILSVALFSGYCSVIFFVKYSFQVTFRPVSRDPIPLKSPFI